MCQDSHGGDKEFVVACKNRPFAMLTSSNYPTPEVNFIDHKLVSELKLKMSELQSCKLHFGSALQMEWSVATYTSKPQWWRICMRSSIPTVLCVPN